MKKVADVRFPAFSGRRCLMMPYIQGDPDSVPVEYRAGYETILEELVFNAGDVGYLTIDESTAHKGQPHRGKRRRYERAIHTEAGRHPDDVYAWGSGGAWGSSHRVTLDGDVEIMIANSVDDSCAVWDAYHPDTSLDGDIGHVADDYPYESATIMQAGEVFQIGILTPHESLPVTTDVSRQFLRIVSAGVHGREPYFTTNPALST